MNKSKLILFVLIAFIFMFGLAELIHLLIETEVGARSGADRTDSILLFTAFCFLIFSFIFSHLLSKGFLLKKGVPRKLQVGAVIGLLLFLPQSAFLYSKIS